MILMRHSTPEDPNAPNVPVFVATADFGIRKHSNPPLVARGKDSTVLAYLFPAE